ncbi:hypothetical protein EVAR_7264_1 [Eumeta japonica]|uniref:Uncharacterized protein n=1 Tax=Eumeta variegata TaxID=151549 RepID=A0A4C1T2D3_EUMVA|nr:hypothetical protein EVAR_7264_1 [Eumeta japonica]
MTKPVKCESRIESSLNVTHFQRRSYSTHMNKRMLHTELALFLPPPPVHRSTGACDVHACPACTWKRLRAGHARGGDVTSTANGVTLSCRDAPTTPPLSTPLCARAYAIYTSLLF